MDFNVFDGYGHFLGALFIPWGELYLLKQTFVCFTTYGELVLL